MILFLYMFFPLFIFIHLRAQDKEENAKITGPSEEEIWSLEGKYILYFGTADHEAILSLYHPEFLGWPDSESHPAGKKRAAEFLKEKYPSSNRINFDLEREGIRMFKNIAITHYLVFSTWIDENGIEKKGKTRITHTWIKEGSEWKIIGGMSNRQ